VEIKDIVAKNFRVLMALNNLNITQVFDKSQIARTTLSNLKNGYSNGIKYETLSKLAKVFEVEPYEFFRERSDRNE